MSLVVAAVKSFIKGTVITLIVGLLLFAGLRHVTHLYMEKASAQAQDVLAVLASIEAREGEPQYQQLVALHDKGQTRATKALMLKATLKGDLLRRDQLLMEAVTKAPDYLLYPLLQDKKNLFIARQVEVIKDVPVGALKRVKGLMMAKYESTLSPAAKTQLSACYERLDARYQGVFSGIAKTYDSYFERKTCAPQV
jgi:hypothetical protein